MEVCRSEIRKLKTINEIMKTANAEMALAAVIDSSEIPKIRDAADQAIEELKKRKITKDTYFEGNW